MAIRYRNYTEDDVQPIIDFWNMHSGWETNFDRNEFDLRFCSSPAGKPVIMLAEDEQNGALLGLCCFVPVRVSVNGETHSAYRPFGAIFNTGFRGQFGLAHLLTGKHPILKLYLTGAEAARENNADLLYLLPDPRWRKLATIMPVNMKKFKLWSKSVSDSELNLPDRFELRNKAGDEAEIDQLWQTSNKTGLCSLIKDAAYYTWKVAFRHGLYQLRTVYCNSKLIGVFTIHFKSRERQWIIADLLTIDNNASLLDTLRAATEAARREHLKLPPSDQTYKVALLVTPLMEEAVAKLAFTEDNYNFYLATQLLSKKSLSKSDVAADKWFIGAND